MATREAVRDMPRTPLAPIDPDVQIPPAVKAAADRANSYYKKAAPAEPAKEPVAAAPQEPINEPTEPSNAPVEPAKEPVAAEPAPVKRGPGRPRNPVPAPEPPPPPVELPPAHPVSAAPAPSPQPDNWEHRYHSMKGRHDALLQSQGSMQEQMAQMGDELMRMQQVLQQRGAPAQNVPAPKAKLVTDDDIKTYGPELVDLARRAGREAVEPELEASHTEIRQLKQALAKNAQAGVQQTLDQQIPEWRTINLDPRFKQWLRLPNIYSGQVRMQMLSNAYQAANAPLVVQLFRDFIADEEATGNYAPAPSAEQPPPPVPRKAAVPLEALAAPGRARPAGGDTAVPADKPSYTRKQIARFYSDVRAGAFLGREVEKARQEAEIFAAQAEGRIRG